jgi:serine/threonine protein kinase
LLIHLILLFNSGSTSFVFKGLPVHRNRPKVAIKEINTTKLSQLQLRDVTFEMNILSQLRHSSIVRLYSVYVLPEKIFLVSYYLFNLVNIISVIFSNCKNILVNGVS